MNLIKKIVNLGGRSWVTLLKRGSGNFLISFSIILGLVISWSLTIILRIWLCIPLNFSRFKKNLEDFSPSSYHWHLLLMRIPSAILYIILHDLVYICCKNAKIRHCLFLKTSSKYLEVVLKTYGQDEYAFLDQDVFWRRMTKENIFALIKTSWRRLLKTKKKDVLKKSSSRQMFAGYSRRQKDCWSWDLVLNFNISRHFDLRNFTVSSLTFTHSKRVRNFFVDPYMGQSIQEWTK